MKKKKKEKEKSKKKNIVIVKEDNTFYKSQLFCLNVDITSYQHGTFSFLDIIIIFFFVIVVHEIEYHKM